VESRLRLVPTRAEEVSGDYVDALRRFCEASPEIEAGYLCAVEGDGTGEARRQLTFRVKIVMPVYERGDVGDVPRVLVQRLAALSPGLVRAFGCGVLADRAVAACETNGIRIYSRGARLG
jgi:hypothetical protein